MEVATTTTEAHLSAIHQSLLQISATLGRMLTYGCVNATSSPDAVVPAKCSTVGLNPNIGAVEVVDSSQQSGIVSTVNPGLVGAPPSSTMQRFGILKSGKHTPTTCSTGVLDVDTDAKNAKRDAGTLQAGLSVHVPWDPGVCNQLSREELPSELLEQHNSGENISTSGNKNSDLCAAWVTGENFLARPSSDFVSFCGDSSGDRVMLSVSLPWDPGVFNELGTTVLQSELVKQQTSGQPLITTYPCDSAARWPSWLSGFSPGKCGHQHDLHWDIMQQLCGIDRQWDPGISTAQVNLIHPRRIEVKGDSLVLSRMSPWNRSVFNLWLGQNTPPDIMQLSVVCLSTEYISHGLICLLLATRKGKKAWVVQCTKTLNFNEILQVQQAGYSPDQIIHGIFSTLVRVPECDITDFCMVGLTIKFLFRALMSLSLNDKYNKFKQATQRQRVECESENTLPSSQTKLEQWRPEHGICDRQFDSPNTLNFNLEQAGYRLWNLSCKHNYFACIAQPAENLIGYYDAEMIRSPNYGLLQYSFSRRNNCCSRHHGATVRAVIRRDGFKRIASEGAEYNIKLGTQSHNFGVQIFCLVATSGNKLQYMIWDPGVHLSVCAISLEVTL